MEVLMLYPGLEGKAACLVGQHWHSGYQTSHSDSQEYRGWSQAELGIQCQHLDVYNIVSNGFMLNTPGRLTVTALEEWALHLHPWWY